MWCSTTLACVSHSGGSSFASAALRHACRAAPTKQLDEWLSLSVCLCLSLPLCLCLTLSVSMSLYVSVSLPLSPLSAVHRQQPLDARAALEDGEVALGRPAARDRCYDLICRECMAYSSWGGRLGSTMGTGPNAPG